MKTTNRILTFITGTFMFVPGMAKFFDPFKTWFISQIELSQLPFPELSRFAGQAGEIIVGATLLSLVIFHKQIPENLLGKVFKGANSIMLFILLVSVYVHLHDDVPAEILPMGFKPPLMSAILIQMTIQNLRLFRKAAK